MEAGSQGRSWRHRCAWALVVVTAIYVFSPGVIVGVVEGDGPRLATGALRMAEGEWGRYVGYHFAISPAIHWLLIAYAEATGLHPFGFFTWITAIFGVVGWLLSAVLIQRLRGGSVVLPAGVLLWMFPGTWEDTMYAHPGTVAWTLAAGALLLPPSSTRWWSYGLAAILMALAGSVRNEFLLFAPLLLALFLWHDPRVYKAPDDSGSSIRKAFVGVQWRWLLTVGISFPALVTGLYVGALWAMGTNLHEYRVLMDKVANDFAMHVAVTHGRMMTIVSYLSAFPVGTIILIAVGSVYLVVRRHFSAVLWMVLGSAHVYVGYFNYGVVTTPKYFYAAAPFLALPIVYLGGALASRRLPLILRGCAYVGLGCLGLQSILSYNFTGATTLSAPGVHLATWWRSRDETPRPLLVVGTDPQAYWLGDGRRPTGGLLFRPLYWWRYKLDMRASQELLRERVAACAASGVTLATITYEDAEAAQVVLFELGYRFSENRFFFKGMQVWIRVRPQDGARAIILEYADSAPSGQAAISHGLGTGCLLAYLWYDGWPRHVAAMWQNEGWLSTEPLRAQESGSLIFEGAYPARTDMSTGAAP